MGLFTITHEVPKKVCCVAEDGCKAPPNCDPVQETRASCFSCGLPVCTDEGCSKVRSYMSYGRRRICADCASMHGLDG